MKKFDMISLEEAGKMAIEEDCIVVDLRGRKDYDVSHIENAINLPNASLKEIEEFNKKDKIWILYCKRGSLSFKLANEMNKVCTFATYVILIVLLLFPNMPEVMVNVLVIADMIIMAFTLIKYFIYHRGLWEELRSKLPKNMEK